MDVVVWESPHIWSKFLILWSVKMEVLNPNRSRPWKKRLTPYQTPKSKLFTLVLFFSCSLLLFISSKRLLPQSLFTVSKTTSHQVPLPPQCGGNWDSIKREKFLWYAPHSGFSNQLSEFKNALLMSAILNRTLIVPPILDHHAVALGSCPKFRVLSPNELRFSVWNHSLDLLRNHRQVQFFIFCGKKSKLFVIQVSAIIFFQKSSGD